MVCMIQEQRPLAVIVDAMRRERRHREVAVVEAADRLLARLQAMVAERNVDCLTEVAVRVGMEDWVGQQALAGQGPLVLAAELEQAEPLGPMADCVAVAQEVAAQELPELAERCVEEAQAAVEREQRELMVDRAEAVTAVVMEPNHQTALDREAGEVEGEVTQLAMVWRMLEGRVVGAEAELDRSPSENPTIAAQALLMADRAVVAQLVVSRRSSRSMAVCSAVASRSPSEMVSSSSLSWTRTGWC
jgi:hypothetical protein